MKMLSFGIQGYGHLYWIVPGPYRDTVWYLAQTMTTKDGILDAIR